MSGEPSPLPVVFSLQTGFYPFSTLLKTLAKSQITISLNLTQPPHSLFKKCSTCVSWPLTHRNTAFGWLHSVTLLSSHLSGRPSPEASPETLWTLSSCSLWVSSLAAASLVVHLLITPQHLVARSLPWATDFKLAMLQRSSAPSSPNLPLHVPDVSEWDHLPQQIPTSRQTSQSPASLILTSPLSLKWDYCTPWSLLLCSFRLCHLYPGLLKWPSN